jgi:hypothetical protein
MYEQMSTLADTEFAALWNSAGSFNEAVSRVRELAGNVPRWAVFSRSSALRRRGVELTHHELRARNG